MLDMAGRGRGRPGCRGAANAAGGLADLLSGLAAGRPAWPPLHWPTRGTGPRHAALGQRLPGPRPQPPRRASNTTSRGMATRPTASSGGSRASRSGWRRSPTASTSEPSWARPTTRSTKPSATVAGGPSSPAIRSPRERRHRASTVLREMTVAVHDPTKRGGSATSAALSAFVMARSSKATGSCRVVISSQGGTQGWW